MARLSQDSFQLVQLSHPLSYTIPGSSQSHRLQLITLSIFHDAFIFAYAVETSFLSIRGSAQT